MMVNLFMKKSAYFEGIGKGWIKSYFQILEW